MDAAGRYQISLWLLKNISRVGAANEWNGKAQTEGEETPVSYAGINFTWHSQETGAKLNSLELI